MPCLNRMIFVTGFARGGTSWLRTCISSHPDVQAIPTEMPIFREFHNDRAGLEAAVDKAIEEAGRTGPWFVNKAPANAPWVAKMARTVPEAKFVFIIRDPRDVFISHKRGNQKWMKGRNSTVDGCMEKIESYFDGYREGATLPNIHLVRYEDLHQDFQATMRKVYEFIGLPCDQDLLDKVYDSCNFQAMTNRVQEDRDAAARKGVVGDWAAYLEPEERQWYEKSEYWRTFMRTFQYGWQPVTYGSILTAMRDAGVESMDEETMLREEVRSDRVNLLLLHDIDLLNSKAARESVLALARVEGELGFASVFNFLPLDDVRYKPLKPEEIVAFIREVQRLAPRATIGLHLNATERFFPAKAPEADETHPLIPDAIAYLHKQVDDYERLGVRFRFGTAHGYGRTTKKQPNNSSEVFRKELLTRGIRLFDDDIRPALQVKATSEARLRDVGGSLTTRRFPNNGRVDDPATYRAFAPGALIHFLIHPGNYDITCPLPLGLRTNLADRAEIVPTPIPDPVALAGGSDAPATGWTGEPKPQSTSSMRRFLFKVSKFVRVVRG